MPPTLAIIGVILLAAALISPFLPAGQFERAERKVTEKGSRIIEAAASEGETVAELVEEHGDATSAAEGVVKKATGELLAGDDVPGSGTVVLITVQNTGTRTVVVPNSYQRVEREERGFAAGTIHIVSQVVTAPIRGFQDKASVIAFILIIGGAFGIILGTGAIDAALRAAVAKLSEGGGDLLVIPACMIMFSLGGAIFGMSEEVIPFVLVTIPLALRLGYDSITGLCMSFVAAGLGFAGAFLNPFTIGVAQGIAEIKVFSGMEFRVVVWCLVTLIGVAYTMRWAMKVKKNPSLSPAFESDKRLRVKFMGGEEQEAHTRFGGRDAAVCFVLMAAVISIPFGVKIWDWYLTELSGVFLAAGILAALVGRMTMEKAADCFTRGAADLAGAALIVAFAAGIVQVLESEMVMDTILNAIATGMGDMHNALAACLMFVFQTALNFFVPSGSGQAAMTMPIMAPLGDTIGVNRQIAVLAFQFGDGFGNMIIPTSAVTMTVLGIAEIPWSKWARWILPLELILATFACVALTVAVAIGYS
ncbi:MAG: TIGR00366 family protein [Sumerlaeia bacterium]